MIAVGLVFAFLVSSERSDRMIRVEASTVATETIASGPDAAKARAAFNEAAKVFFSPRCANCHPAGDGPTQGDTMTPHSMDVKRGPDGRGVEELKCATCHQDINLEGDGLPPGAPDWHMPAAEHKMSFQGITIGQLCRNLKDPVQNGGKKTAKDAVLHLATDPKVVWAWNPGNGRTTPPMSQADFMKKMNEWVANGAACPE
jgi:cytochrome c5